MKATNQSFIKKQLIKLSPTIWVEMPEEARQIISMGMTAIADEMYSQGYRDGLSSREDFIGSKKQTIYV